MNLDRNDFKTYSLADNPNMKLSDNLSLSEVASKCGTNVVRVHPYMPIMFQAIRNEFGAPITINSGYRSPQHNANVGGATESTHVYGMALDLSASDLSALDKAIQTVIEQNKAYIGGYKRYKTFIHVDCWKRRTW